MIKELKMAIKEWIKNYKTWQKNSKNLYDNIFSKRAWEKSFLDIFKQ
jgi:glycosyltransferase involved in cell wall biosynthesis